ncbi:MAG: hypothetical protein R8K48_05955, partial [Gallionella sp.]
AIEAASPATAALSSTSITVTGARFSTFSSDIPAGVKIKGVKIYVFESDGRASINGSTTFSATGTALTKVLTVTPVGQVVLN